MQTQNNARILSHDERALIEGTITGALGEAVDDIGLVVDNLSFTYDRDKNNLIVEKYSGNGAAIEFYEVRLVVGYVGNGNFGSEQI